MIATIIFNVFAVFFAFLESSSRSRWYLFISFLIIFAFLALRYDFGNDYLSYYEYFSDVHKIPISDLLNFQAYKSYGLNELGYAWLNRLFPSFYLLVAVLALLSCYVYYNSISFYVSKDLIWFSVFIFLFNPALLLFQSSSIRQTIAICFFLYSVRFLIERSFWKYCLLFLMGSLFHRSTIILLPIYVFATPEVWRQKVIIILVSIYLFITFFGYTLLGSIDWITNQFFSKYQLHYMNNISTAPINTGIGFMVWSLIFLFIVWSHNKSDEKNAVISKLSIIGFVLSPMGIYLAMFERIGLFFEPFILLSLPFAIKLQESKLLKQIIIIMLILWYGYQFYEFFHHPTWIEKYSTYKINLLQLR